MVNGNGLSLALGRWGGKKCGTNRKQRDEEKRTLCEENPGLATEGLKGNGLFMDLL